MRKLLILLFIGWSVSSFSQNVHLDQPMYLSGDTIRAVAYFQSADIVPYAYHLSLFDAEGKQVSHHLMWANDMGIEIALPISPELETGQYVLQLTNYQNSIVTHAEKLLVVHPEGEIDMDLTLPDQQIGWAYRTEDAISVELFDSPDSTNFKLQVLEDGIGSTPVELNTGHSAQVGTRSNSALQVNLRNDQFKIFKARGLRKGKSMVEMEAAVKNGSSELSIAFSTELARASVSVFDLSQNPGHNSFPILPDNYLPDCQSIPPHSRVAQGLKTWLTGFELKGLIRDSASNEPKADQRIVLANPSDEFDLKYTATNDQGIFGFYNLDFTQRKNLYLSLVGEDDSPVNFEYVPRKGDLISAIETCPTIYSITHDDLTEMVRLRLLDRKVKEQYLNHRELPTRRAIYSPKLIFEDADHTILLSDYVDFGTMKEVIKEIIPYVFTSKKGIGVFSVDQKKSFPVSPLILINGVPASSDEVVLGLDVSKVHSVQVLNKLATLSPYGNLALGGVVSIVMSEEFQYPEAIEQVTLDGYFEGKNPQNPKKSPSTPFLPASVYWDGNLELDEGKRAVVNFETPDYETRLGVEVFGLSPTGIVIQHYEEITITNTPK